MTLDQVKAHLKKRIDHHHFWVVNTGRECTYSTPEKHRVARDELQEVMTMISLLEEKPCPT